MHTLPQLVLRTGINSDIELHLLWNGWNIDHTDDHSSKTSISDVSIGGKYRLIKNDKYNLTTGVKNIFDNTQLLGTSGGSGHGGGDGASSLVGWGRTYFVGINYNFTKH